MVSPMQASMEAAASREDATGTVSAADAVHGDSVVSWDPYDVWLNRVKRPREARESGRPADASAGLAA